MQEGLLFHTLYDPGTGVYVEQLDFTFHGKLNIPAFKQAWQQVIDRHSVLRTLFIWERRDNLLQVVRQQIKLPWAEYDWRPSSPEVQQEQLASFLRADRIRGFDLARAPLMRLALIQMSEENYRFIWSFHHLLLDGWSISLVLNEVYTIYEANCRGEKLLLKPGPPYQRYIEWLQQQDLSEAELFWRQALEGFTTPTSLLVNRASGHLSSPEQEYGEQHRRLSPLTTAALKSLARQQQITLNTVLQASWALLLSRYSGAEDVVFGATVSGRPADLAGVEDMVGLFINTLPVRVQIPSQVSLLTWLKELQTQQAEARQYEYSPLAKIQEWSEVPRGQALFENILVFENYPASDFTWEQGEDITVHNIRFIEKTNYPLTLTIVPGSELWLQVNYNSHCFDHTTISRMLGHLQTLLEGMVAHPEVHLSALPLLTAAEREQMLVTWNESRADYPKEMCIHHLFEAQVTQTPDAVAILSVATQPAEAEPCPARQLTYRELNAQANQLAHYLQELGVRPEVRVGICLERSLETVVGLMGILKAGGAYVPLDPTYPAERLAFMLADAQVPVLLTQERLIEKLPAPKARVICLDTGWGAIAAQSEQNPISRVTSGNLAYVIYTSGSTGKPKGTMISHQGLVNYLAWCTKAYGVADARGAPVHSSIGFDLTITSLFSPLLVGRSVMLLPDEPGGEALSSSLLSEGDFSLVKITPAHLDMLSQLLPAQKAAAWTKRLIIGGEALWAEKLTFWQNHAPNTRLINEYGPTETVVGCCVYEVPATTPTDAVPIGRPIANTQLYLLDRHLRPAPIGVPGELYTGGDGVARGYLNRPDLTGERFIPNPFGNEPGGRLYKTGDLARYLPDGNIEFLGRLDYQVKIRGYRIELGEIEAVLTGHPAVREAVVTVQNTELAANDPSVSLRTDRRLVAYVVAAQKPAPTPAELRGFLKEKLPDNMIPSAFMTLETMPLTPNGKVDRRALPTPAPNRPELANIYVAPRNPVEKLLANIWTDVLGLERVGIYDDFFELGGHSLLATRLIFRVRDTFQVDLSLRNFFEKTNVANLAQAIDAIRRLGPSTTVTYTDFETEAVLDAAIQPGAGPYEPVTEPDAIFLTGATGFLGAFLLYELLQQTQAKIFCLVRAADIETGRQRIQRKLETYLLWHSRFGSRIIPVVGDLSQPCLGLSGQQFQMLAGLVDAIYHNGAVINFVYPYYKLKPTNVLGTQEVLKLATQIKAISVHYVSTLSVFDSLAYLSKTKPVILEKEELNYGEGLLTGYAQSKWVAEKMVTEARSRGLSVCIYRPAVVVGDSQTGVWNTGDFICRFIKGCIQLGSTPDLDEMLRLTPVDYVSKAIVHLSRQPESLGKAFHVVTPYRLHQSQLDDWIRASGYELRQLPYDQWQAELIKVAGQSPGHALYPLLPLFLEKVPATENLTIPELFTQDREPTFDRQNLRDGLTDTDIVCPPIDAELFGTYLSYFIRSGFLAAPPSREKLL